MAYSSGGIYTGLANSFNNAASGTRIDQDDWNALFTDIESALNSYTTSIPVTVTSATYSVLSTDSMIIANRAGTVTLTLLSAVTYAGRWLRVKTIQNQTVVSNSSDVVPLAGGAAGTAILSGTAGKWATLQSNGTSWEIMAAN